MAGILFLRELEGVLYDDEQSRHASFGFELGHEPFDAADAKGVGAP